MNNFIWNRIQKCISLNTGLTKLLNLTWYHFLIYYTGAYGTSGIK